MIASPSSVEDAMNKTKPARPVVPETVALLRPLAEGPAPRAGQTPRLRSRPGGLEESLRQFDGKSILITGGTGSVGRRFADTLLRHSSARRVIIFSRDEFKQY